MNTQAPPDTSLFSIDGIIYLLFRRKWLILLGLLAGAGAAGYIWFATPPKYQSEAKLLVRYVAESTSMDPGAEGGGILRPDNRGSNIMNSEAEILRSRDLAAAVVTRIGPEVIFPPKREGAAAPGVEAAADAVLKSLAITIPRDSNIIQLGFFGPTPEVAQQVLEQMIEEYLEKHQAIHSAASSYGFFSQKTDQLRADLRATEAELQQLKQRIGVVDIDESKTMLVERLGQLRQRLDEQQGLIASAEARAALLQEQLGMAPTPLASAETTEAEALDPEAEAARAQSLRQLTLLREQELKLLARYTPESTPVRNIQLQIAEAERRAGVRGQAQPIAALAGGATEDLGLQKELILERSRVVSAQAMMKLLLEQQEAIEGEIQRLNQDESRIVELSRQREIQDAAYRRFADALDTAKNQLALAPDQLSNIITVEPATLPLRPEKPDTVKKYAAMAGAAGLGVFGGLALLLELLGARSLRRPQEIERTLAVPTLITFPRASAFKKPFALASGRKLLAASNGDKSGKPPEPSRTVREPVQDYYESLLHRLETTGVFDGEIPHLIGVVSCNEGAGTTTVATGLALTMSQREGAKTLLIDGDLGKGGAHRVLGVKGATSLPKVLLDGGGQSSRVQEGLYMLSAGNGEHKAARLSLGRRFRDLVAYLKQSEYTSVVLDLPPVHETSTALQMAGLLDGVILVVESEKVSREKARAALKMLSNAHANVVGVVLNKKREYVPDWLDAGA